MPLPEKWTGMFWSKETNGDLLFDLHPQSLANLCAASDPCPAFLMAGAYVDLTLNDAAEKANALLAVARERFPHKGWDWLVNTTSFMTQIVRAGGHSALAEDGIFQSSVKNTFEDS